MADDALDLLRKTLVASYDDLAARLTRVVGSRHAAEEALQDTWLRLERSGSVGEVRNARGYLLRMALNIARDRRRSESRLASAESIEAILGLADDTPGPAHVVEFRSELDALKAALAELPLRRRQIFLAAWSEGLPHAAIAQRFGLTPRMINIELAKAREYCALRLKQPERSVLHFPRRGGESSYE